MFVAINDLQAACENASLIAKEVRGTSGWKSKTDYNDGQGAQPQPKGRTPGR